METLLDVHGATALLSTDCGDFTHLIRSNYEVFLAKEPLEPNLNITFSQEAGYLAKKKKKSMPRLSEGLYQGKDSLYWENEFGFVVHISFKSFKEWNIYGYHFDLDNHNQNEEDLRNYTRSMRWMVHFPLFSLLKKYQSMRLVHASAISKNSNALIFAGLNKVGKSSLSRYLYENYQYEFMSDNFLLTDGKKVYGFPEKNRLAPDSLENLKISSRDNKKIYGKFHLPFDKNRLELRSQPKSVFIVNNHKDLKIECISRDSALNSLEGMHSYLQEFPEYTFFSMLDSFDSWKERDCSLFPEDVEFYRIYLPLDWSLSETAEKVLECI